MELEYIKIKQHNEEFYLTKIKATDLLQKLDFHFRQAYTDDKTEIKYIDEYIKSLEKKGLSIVSDSEGIQRRLSLSRIKEISKFLENADSFFPNCVILSVNIENLDYDDVFCLNSKGQQIIQLSEDTTFQIIDGQHRLAGLFLSDESIKKDFEVPIVLFINVTKNFCAKIFIDVNGNQKPVNSSVIYDLYDFTPDGSDFENDKKLHFICKTMNEEVSSPLYKHIKMLGIGRGSISQAFLVDALRKCYKDANINYDDVQYMYTQIAYYLKSFQRLFQDQWAVLENAKDEQEFWNHSNRVMKELKSQMLKTNGLGGILRAFPKIHDSLGLNPTYKQYFELLGSLKGKIDWCSDSIFTEGTGAKNQDKIKIHLLKLLNIKY